MIRNLHINQTGLQLKYIHCFSIIRLFKEISVINYQLYSSIAIHLTSSYGLVNDYPIKKLAGVDWLICIGGPAYNDVLGINITTS
jgi:hypothetical protein